MNRSAIRGAVITTLRESATPVRWALAELNRYIDDGYRDLAERTQAVVRTDTLTVSPSQNYLVLPTDCLFPICAKDVASDLPIDPVHWSFFDNQDRVWIRTSGTRPRFFSLWDWRTLLLYPHYPAGGGSIALTMSIMPTGLTSDGDAPAVPEEYHDALVHYATWRCLVKGAKGARFGRANRQLGFYSERLQGLGIWTQERHEGIFTAIYGQSARVPTDLGLLGSL